MTNESSPLVLNAQESAIVATTLTAEALERWISELASADVPAILLSVNDAQDLLRAMQKGLEARMTADGRVGTRVTINDREYVFIGAQQKGYKDFPGLMRFLIQDCGLAPLAIADAVTEAKVTTLREAIATIQDPELRDAALAEVEAHRVPVGQRGQPHLTDVARLSK